MSHSDIDKPLATQRLETIAQRYYELLFAVSQKHEGEDRHATALRYIRERDSGSGPKGEAGTAECEAPQSGGSEASASPNPNPAIAEGR